MSIPKVPKNHTMSTEVLHQHVDDGCFGENQTTVHPDSISSDLQDAVETKSFDQKQFEKSSNNTDRVKKIHYDDNEVYRCLVVDSGPIIKHTGLSALWKKANHFYTVPAVLKEIRDAKSREHLAMLPFDLIARQPSFESIHIVTEFAKKTGDYQSLSAVDIQVMALVYELEKEGCLDSIDHIRKTPKRIVGLGKIENLSKDTPKNDTTHEDNSAQQHQDETISSNNDILASNNQFPTETSEVQTVAAPLEISGTNKPKTWAAMVSPAGSNAVVCLEPNEDSKTNIGDKNLHVPFGSMNIVNSSDAIENSSPDDGQFSDPDDDSSDTSSDDEDDDDESEDSEDEDAMETKQNSLDDKLNSEYPSLGVAASVSMLREGNNSMDNESTITLEERRKLEEERRLMSLKPITNKSGKLYNSFGKYSDLLKAKPIVIKTSQTESNTDDSNDNQHDNESFFSQNGFSQQEERRDEMSSRIFGGTGFSGQDDFVEDDGEGWITTKSDITTMKASGALDPNNNTNNLAHDAKKITGPPAEQRTACATTDFAMQNVLLQMNLPLLSVDGMKIRKLKNWVTRCGACYKIYTSSEYRIGGYGSRRLFCSHCGSDMMQRIACSVDGKTGRLRLHLSKKHKHNLRGTKFSLPKPGTGNRFQGDLLLREDQLLMGAWSLKARMRSGGKAKEAAESIFGNDIASNVGCQVQSMSCDDIRVGFGRRNPNAAKGRERRGKKKKSSEKACGLRRY